MTCPACGSALSPRTIAGIQLDCCEAGCHGIWFDNLELKKFDEPHEPVIHKFATPSANPGTYTKRKCPKCKDITLFKRFSSAKKKVEVDECGQCAGIWLDAGEIESIRSEFKTEGERVAAAEATFQEMFGAALDEKRAKSQEELESARRIARVFKFICPSYYIPGKQHGGAY